MHKEGHTPMNNDPLDVQSSSASKGQDHHGSLKP